MRSGRLFWNCPCRRNSNCSKTSITEKSGTLCTLHHISRGSRRSSACRSLPASSAAVPDAALPPQSMESCLPRHLRVPARRFGEEQCNEFVQEALPERRWPDVLEARFEQAARNCLGQRFLHAGGIESGAFAEKQGGHTLRQTQGVEHEFECHIVPARPLLAADPGRGPGFFKVVARLFHFPQARDALRLRDLGVRAGADAGGVAELAVVEIVPATAPRGRPRPTRGCARL